MPPFFRFDRPAEPVEAELQPHEIRRLRLMRRFRDENRQYAGGAGDGNHYFLRPAVLALELERLLGVPARQQTGPAHGAAHGRTEAPPPHPGAEEPGDR